MKCPVCNIDMIVVEFKQIELDYCFQCLGVWFDSGELELLLETMKDKPAPAPESILTPVEAQSAEKRRKCPICGKKMKKAEMCAEPKVRIDSCPQGEGLWLDGGELGQVVAQFARSKCASADVQSVLAFLSEAFQAQRPVSR